MIQTNTDKKIPFNIKKGCKIVKYFYGEIHPTYWSFLNKLGLMYWRINQI